MDATRFEFVIKKRENFGGSHGGSGGCGLLGGDPFEEVNDLLGGGDRDDDDSKGWF